MNYAMWTRKKFILFTFAVFFIGAFFNYLSMPTKTVTQEVIKEVPKEVVREVPKEVVKEVEVDKNHAVWLQLVSVDDQILGVASKGFMDVSTALTQYANGNMNAFSDLSVNLNLKVATITKLSTQRHTLLNQLGVE